MLFSRVFFIKNNIMKLLVLDYCKWGRSAGWAHGIVWWMSGYLFVSSWYTMTHLKSLAIPPKNIFFHPSLLKTEWECQTRWWATCILTVGELALNETENKYGGSFSCPWRSNQGIFTISRLYIYFKSIWEWYQGW